MTIRRFNITKFYNTSNGCYTASVWVLFNIRRVVIWLQIVAKTIEDSNASIIIVDGKAPIIVSTYTY